MTSQAFNLLNLVWRGIYPYHYFVDGVPHPGLRTYRWSSVETISGFPGAVASRILNFMSTLHDIEALVAQFSPEQLAELERFVRQMRLQKTRSGGPSVLDLAPLDLGRSLQPLGTREQWYDEMLEGRV